MYAGSRGGTGRPATPRRRAVPTAADPLYDIVAAAKRPRTNSELFTAEHRAAYYAHAGIDDEHTARLLFRWNILWDDIHAYTAAGINLDGYDRMVKLAAGGVTPTLFTYWHKNLNADLLDDDLTAYVAKGFTVAMVHEYLAVLPGDEPLQHKIIVSLHDNGISPARTKRYVAAGTPLNTITTAVAAAVHPDTIRHCLAENTSSTPQGQDNTRSKVIALCNRMHRAASHGIDAEFTNAVYSHPRLSEADLTAWHEIFTTHPTPDAAARVRALLDAGYSHDETRNQPDLLNIDLTSLRMLAVLRGTSTEAPRPHRATTSPLLAYSAA